MYSVLFSICFTWSFLMTKGRTVHRMKWERIHCVRIQLECEVSTRKLRSDYITFFCPRMTNKKRQEKKRKELATCAGRTRNGNRKRNCLRLYIIWPLNSMASNEYATRIRLTRFARAMVNDFCHYNLCIYLLVAGICLLCSDLMCVCGCGWAVVRRRNRKISRNDKITRSN